LAIRLRVELAPPGGVGTTTPTLTNTLTVIDRIVRATVFIVAGSREARNKCSLFALA
jgi:hypothetical protein